MNRKAIAIRQFVAVSLAVFAVLFVVGHCACTPTEAAQVVAASSYEAQQMRCVEQYARKVDIDACRYKVKEAWAFDAGKDGDR